MRKTKVSIILFNLVAFGIVIILGNLLTVLLSLKPFSFRIEKIVTIDTNLKNNSVFTTDRALSSESWQR